VVDPYFIVRLILTQKQERVIQLIVIQSLDTCRF